MAVRQVRGRAEWKKFSAAFSEALGDVGEQMTNFGKMAISDSCQQWLKDLDAEWPHHTDWVRNSGKVSSFGGDHFHPWYYGQLHDSIFTRVAEKNRTVSIHYMPPSATKPQHATYKDAGQKYDRIVGAEFAAQESHNVQYVFLPGIQAQLVVAVPYARKVNELPQHAGYLDNLQAEFFSYIEDRIFEIFEDNPKNRTRVFKPKK